MSGCGEGAEWVEQLRAPRQGHCTSQSQPVKATLLRRAVTPFVTIPRRLRRQNGVIWYYLVHDNFFVSGIDWGTRIVAATVKITVIGFTASSNKRTIVINRYMPVTSRIRQTTFTSPLELLRSGIHSII